MISTLARPLCVFAQRIVFRLPDMLALSDPEVELPTLRLDSDNLDTASLSSLVNTTVVQVDENTVPGQHQQITFHLEDQPNHNNDIWPCVTIVEQPASHKLRFRYQCEGRGAGALQGQFSTVDKKVFPRIQIHGYHGPAVVVVSCVTHDHHTPRAHPHNLVSPASVST